MHPTFEKVFQKKHLFDVKNFFEKNYNESFYFVILQMHPNYIIEL